MGLSVATVVVSWVSVHVGYAVHYASCYYGEGGGGPGLEFPGTPEPRLLDFAYLAFTIGTTAATTDVVVGSTTMRRRVLGHTLLSFVYNTVVLALVLAVVAGLS